MNLTEGDKFRFWIKVNKNGPIPEYRPDLGPCWIWTGGSRGRGGAYGAFSLLGKAILAHRFSYEMVSGSIASGMTIDHLCRVRLCVRPEHLEQVTKRENILRGTCPAAMQAKQTHCKRGHEFTPDNTYVYESGRRYCRICKTALDAARYRRRNERKNH